MRIGHQTAHAGQLGDGTKAALARARQGHDRQRPGGVHRLLHGVGHLVLGLVPLLDGALVLLLFGQQTAAELAVDLVDALAGGVQNLLARLRDGQIGHGHGRARHGGEAEADVLDGVDHADRRLVAEHLMDAVDERVHATLIERAVDEPRPFRQRQVEQHAAGRRLDDARDGLTVVVAIVAVVLPVRRREDLDLGVDVHVAQLVGRLDLFQAAERAPFALQAVAHDGNVVDAEHHVL